MTKLCMYTGPSLRGLPCFYASAFWRRRHYVFGLFVRSPKYPLSTCTWVQWSIRPTMTVLRHVRPSGEVSRHLPENAWREWPEILHTDVSWPLSELIRLWSWSVDFPPFGATLTLWNGSIWGFRAFPREHINGMAWNFACCCILGTFRTG